MRAGGLALTLLCVLAAAPAAGVPGAGRALAADADNVFALEVDSPTAKLGERTVIVATISARDGFRITESYRHRIVNLATPDGGLELPTKPVRGSVTAGRIVFRVEVLARTPGAHPVAGVVRFSVNNGQQLDIKAVPFETTVTATP